MLTCTSPALGKSSPSARTPGKPPSRSRTADATSRAASSDPSKLTLNAISGRRAPTRSQLAVEEDRQAELDADPLRKHQGGFPRAPHVLRHQRDHGNHVRGPNPRVRPLVLAQVDPLARTGDPREQRLDELLG